MNISRILAQKLLEIKAFVFRPQDFFTWTSGIQSPVYCDNRLILSYPEVRNLVVDAFLQKIQEHFSEIETIAGVATAGIPYAAFIAQRLNLPMIYVRSAPKSHGKENLVEGVLPFGQTVLLFEDLISFGGSSIQAANTIQTQGGKVLAIFSIFSYEFPFTKERFQQAKFSYYTLTDFETLIQEALAGCYLQETDIQTIRRWQEQLSHGT